jgi:hypothetical protein
MTALLDVGLGLIDAQVEFTLDLIGLTVKTCH